MSEWQKVNDILHKGVKMEELRCKNCDRLLKEYDGKYGKFLGCPNFISDDECKTTYSMFERK